MTKDNRPPACERHAKQFGSAITIVTEEQCPWCWGDERRMSLSEAATALNVSATTLRVQIGNGKLEATKIGPIWTVSESEVERYRQENRRGHD